MRSVRMGIRSGLVLLALCLTWPASAQERDTPHRMVTRLQQGVPAIGTFGDTLENDLDFVVIDYQYRPLNFEDLARALVSLRNEASTPSLTPIVRIPRNNRDAPASVVDQVLDLGVSGIMFPDIETPEQALMAVGSMRFTEALRTSAATPVGQRDADVGRAPASWGMSEHEYRTHADLWPLNPDGRLVALLQIESQVGIEQLDEILAVPGVGAIFLGPFDLATSLGEERPDAPQVETLIQSVLQNCRRANISCGYPIVAQTRADAERETRRRLSEGFMVLAVMVTTARE